jgi:seryl-tRNA synthetase
MLDIRQLRHDPDAVAANLARRGFAFDRARFDALEAERKHLQIEVENRRKERNEISAQIGRIMRDGGNADDLKARGSELAAMLEKGEQDLHGVAAALEDLLAHLPNLLHESVPDGRDESANAEQRRIGKPRVFDFEPLDHVAIGERLGTMDFEAAVKVSGSRFVVLRDELARLHRALIALMLDMHTTEHGYRETYVPYLVNAGSLFGTGQLPKFAEDLFAVTGETELHLIPTAEVPLTNLVRDTIVDANALPMKFVAHTPCFRSEAGSYGKDTRGMIRQHQFEKVELVHMTSPDDSFRALEELVGHAEEILKRLELPYRVVTLCSGDTGFSAAKTYDIEVWLPGQDRYREISSCSNCEAFQARRMHARWRNPATGKPEPLHTLNGSGVAIGRALIAVLENYQQADGSVLIPDALRPYMGGLERMTPVG